LIALVDLAPAKGPLPAPTDLAFCIGEEAREYPIIPAQAGIPGPLTRCKKPDPRYRASHPARGDERLWFESSET
jgi:hypothetical protein